MILLTSSAATHIPSTKGRAVVRAVLALLVTACLATVPSVSAGQAPDTTSALAGLRTRTLANGLKVVERTFPGDNTADVLLLVGGGASLDPVGKEELAHFAEHVVFGDRPGLTEHALNAQVESLGGTITASTNADRTMFRVTIPQAHVAEAVQWMARLVGPRDVSPALVQQQLPPILLELQAAPRSFSGRVRARVLDPPWLRRASVWKQDFALDTYADRNYDAFASLHRITSHDVQDFLDRYYVPSNMTLVVAGGGDGIAGRTIDSAFAPLAARPAPLLPRGTLQGTQRTLTIWAPQREATHARILRGSGLGAHDRALVTFLHDFLDKRLNDRLRYGDAKLVYHPSVALSMLNDAAILTIVATSNGSSMDRVQAIIGDEVARLRKGGAADSAFLADRRTIAERVHLATRGREALVEAMRSHFFATPRDEPIPDVAALADTVTPATLATLLARHFPPAGENTRTMRPVPVPLPFLIVAALGLAWLTLSVVRTRLVVPAHMRTLRYVARLRTDLPVAAALWLTGAFAVAVLARLGSAGARPFLESAVFPLPGPLQLATYGFLLVVGVATAIGLAARVPRKLMVFDDHLRLKFLAYRSLVIRPGNIAECRMAGFRDGWSLGAFCRGFALTLGLGGSAMLLRLRDGRSLLVRTRDTRELHDAVTALMQRATGA